MSFLQKIISKLEKIRNESVVVLSSDKDKNEDEAKKIIAEGNKFEDFGDFQNALNLYEKSINIAPKYIGGYINKGNIFLSLSVFDLAIEMYLKAISVNPNHSGAYLNLGHAQYDKKEFELALIAYNKAIALNCDYVDAWIGKGNSLADLGKKIDAIESYKKAIFLNPNNPEIYKSIGLAYEWMGYLREAKDNFQTAIKLQPERIDFYCSICNVYREMGDINNSIDIARKGCAIDPKHMGIHSLLLFSLSHSLDVTKDIFFQEHLNFGKKFKFFTDDKNPVFTNDKNQNKILKIGIVSADLRNHAVSSFFEPIYDKLLNESSVILYIYDNMGAKDGVSKRMKEKTKNWRFIGGQNDSEIEIQIKQDGIDILIDLSGHTAGHRLSVFARKPAPIQISWIGYPGTTGLTEIDYYIGDRHFLPPGKFDDIFIEKIIRLPATTSFGSLENPPDVTPLPVLKNGFFTFGSFNRLDKFNEKVISLWAETLLNIPNSKMLIGAMPITGDFEKIIKWFEKYKISKDRLIFHKRTNMYNYLSLYNEVDVCLDTFPYGGSTTTSHALVMGVPTLTLTGEIPISNAGYSILSQLNLSDLFCATNRNDFINKSIWISENISYLSELRKNLRSYLKSSNLMNDELIASSLGFAFKYIWSRWCNNLPSISFEIIKSNEEFKIIEQ